MELHKKDAETRNRSKEFAKLYEVVKNERNSYVNAIQASSQALAEMKERIKILQNEVEILSVREVCVCAVQPQAVVFSLHTPALMYSLPRGDVTSIWS